jgi:hypothetical protein
MNQLVLVQTPRGICYVISDTVQMEIMCLCYYLPYRVEVDNMLLTLKN